MLKIAKIPISTQHFPKIYKFNVLIMFSPITLCRTIVKFSYGNG